MPWCLGEGIESKISAIALVPWCLGASASYLLPIALPNWICTSLHHSSGQSSWGFTDHCIFGFTDKMDTRANHLHQTEWMDAGTFISTLFASFILNLSDPQCFCPCDFSALPLMIILLLVGLMCFDEVDAVPAYSSSFFFFTIDRELSSAHFQLTASQQHSVDLCFE